MVKRKRNAMLKYLKNDIGDLLKTGLDVNAYSRAEGFLVELNLSNCYDLLEQYCDHITNNLSVMYKQRECPEECREAVASLIFAAARFADVPELREIRSLFTERYGNFLECYVSKEFLQHLKSEPPTKEMKLQLMKDITSESGIEWNSKALEQKLFNPLMPEQDWSRNDQKHNLRGKMEESPWRKDSEVAKFNRENARQPTTDKLECNSYCGRKVVPDDEHGSPMKGTERSYRRRRDSVSRKSHDSPPVKDSEDSTDIERQKNKPEIEIVPEGESDDKKPFGYRSSLPPYVKSRASLTRNTSDTASPTSSSTEEEKAKNKPMSARTRRATKITISDDKEPPDEEEKLMDRILMYLSRKNFQSSVNTPKEAAVDSSSQVSRRRSMGNRALSLPADREQTSPRGLNRGHVRANSFQPDMLGPNKHVHPKLPDYDDFVARLASLREQSRQ
ncbi:putative pyridoxal biosynthesis protein PDX1.2-like [Capsicum annuum]|nr:putative pyridoxal biosynthesis protein PDX1.2-like [Capsicum annuum]KAF3660279.1 putative pyridoxal biosynthesis protein PDX1.2-like [Capsicum annuum]